LKRGNRFDKFPYPSGYDKSVPDLRSYAQQARDYIISLAQEAGTENEQYVQNALRAINFFSLDHHLIKRQVKIIEHRLSKRIDQIRRNKSGLPGADILKGDIQIGVLADDPKQSVSLTFKESTMDTFLFGKKGEGKTNTILHMVSQYVRKGKFCMMFDIKIKPEYRDLIQIPECSNMAILPPRLDKDNIFDPQGEPFEEWLLWIWDILQQSYEIREPSRLMLIEYCQILHTKQGVFCLHDLKDFIEERLKNSATPKSEKNKIITIRSIISVILLDAGAMLECNQGYSLKNILQNFSLVSYELGNVSEKGKQWISKFKLKRLHQIGQYSQNKDGLNIIVVSDEAKMLFGKQGFQTRHMDYIKILHTQSRGALGLGWIIADQSYSSELADFVLENIETQICFRLVSPSQIRSAAFSMGCDASEIPRLHQPFALMRKGNSPYPFKIRIDKMRPLKRTTELEVDRLMKNKLAALNYVPRQNQNNIRVKVHPKIETEHYLTKQNKSVPTLLETINNNPLKDFNLFLRFVYENPSTNITSLFKALNLSGRKGDGLKTKLVESGLLEQNTVRKGGKGRPSKTLQLTEKGRQYINEK
jgi:predicted transcriptional regulator